MEKTSLFSSSSWCLSNLILLVLLYSFFCTGFVSCKCLDHQKSLLLDFKKSLTPDISTPSDKLVGWNQSSPDCCQWSGVECDTSNGRVIGLDLSWEDLTGGIDNSSSLFRLQFLQRLNLAGYKPMQVDLKMPSAFGKLTSLTYLNLSNTAFRGQVPIEISHLVNLDVLDMSGSYQLYMKRPNLATIIKNMTNLKELYLDNVRISAMGNRLSSSVPNLQVLSMSECYLGGEIHKSLSNLNHLSEITLDNNNMIGPVPEFLADFANLTKLSLSANYINGTFPEKIIQIPTLRVLDLSDNSNLQGNLPEFPKNGSLEVLSLSGTSFSSTLPSSIANLKRLRALDLDSCHFHGHIPSSIASLERLEGLDLSSNQFEGPIPSSIGSLERLEELHLSYNQLEGPIPSSIGSLKRLELLYLSGNQFEGPIPSSIGSLERVEVLHLSGNQFEGRIPSLIGSLERLEEFSLSQNQFEGPIPKSLFQLKQLNTLHLDSNNLNGTLQLSELLFSFKKLTDLNLSNNSRLSINIDDCSANFSFPQLESLYLASCNLQSIPECLKNQTRLDTVDLSMNHITGTIPGWMWSIATFNLSNNHFVKLEPPMYFGQYPVSVDPFDNYVDLHSNNLQGEFPYLSFCPAYLDCSRNKFTSIHPKFSEDAYSAHFISFSKNSLYGSIPTSLCNATDLSILNLEYNNLSGTIPRCLFAMPHLQVLNLRGNRLGGHIPDKFAKRCNLETLQLNGNFLRGQVPLSLAHCKPLKVLDLGHNQFHDIFPCHLKSLSNLHVLILRSNKFHGNILCLKGHTIWPLLQILDLAFNNVSDDINTLFLLKWKSMIASKSAVQPKPEYLEGSPGTGYYQYSVAVTSKGVSYDLQFILTTFTTIDVSNNAFHGELPVELGNLNALVVLNVSHNFLSGHIPPSIGNLSQIESLDLSCNTFNGRIPFQLANLNFLGYLNLSYNKLSGKIPTGTQLQSFDASSYEGNQGLYGPPLTSDRPDPTRTTPSSSTEGSSWTSKDHIGWMLRGAEVGFPVGITIFFGPLLYIKRYRDWYCEHLHRLVMKMLRKEDDPRGRGARNRQPRQRR